jgi:hypothetical protein
MESRWLRWMGPGLLALVAVGTIASVASGAGQRPWTPAACADGGDNRGTAVRRAQPVVPGDLATEAWYRLDPKLDRDGGLEGQRLALGLGGSRVTRVMDLPAESFAAGPFGRIVLVGADDGVLSQLVAVDVDAACSWTVAEDSTVIRRATIDPDGLTVYEMRVDRATRADLGIWSRPLDGSLPAVRILDPIGSDERFGPTFTTEFSWDVEGARSLAVQSCGEMACRTRVLDLFTRQLRVVEDPDLGPSVGLAGDTLVSYAQCPGFPCPIAATSLTTGSRSILAEAAAVAAVVRTPDGPRLVHEFFDTSEIGLRAMALDGSSAIDLGRLPGDFRLQAGPSAADAATRTPSGWVLLSPDARIPVNGPTGAVLLRHVPDGATVQLGEVIR